jgi:hypothetical protein
VATARERHFRVAAFIGVWIGSCLCCALAIVFFYGVGHAGTYIYPFKDRSEQVVAALQTAIAAMLISSWAIWFGISRKRSRGMAVLQAALATEASLTIYALAGLQLAIRDWRSPLDLIFPSTFFAEYNWLTFILEVAPVTSCAVTIFLFLRLRGGDQRPLVGQA